MCFAAVLSGDTCESSSSRSQQGNPSSNVRRRLLWTWSAGPPLPPTLSESSRAFPEASSSWYVSIQVFDSMGIPYWREARYFTNMFVAPCRCWHCSLFNNCGDQRNEGLQKGYLILRAEQLLDFPESRRAVKTHHFQSLISECPITVTKSRKL